MPVSIKKVGKGSYRVATPHGIKAKHTTKAKAAAQKRLLQAVDHGWKPTGRKSKKHESLALSLTESLIESDWAERWSELEQQHKKQRTWSTSSEMTRGYIPRNGAKVRLAPEYADSNPNEVYTVSQVDRERGKCWISDKNGRGWFTHFEQLIPWQTGQLSNYHL